MNISEWEINEIQKAYERTGDPPNKCPTCKGELTFGKGMVGEDVMWCPIHGLVWEDFGGAVSRLI
jgi:hypothetical protein